MPRKRRKLRTKILVGRKRMSDEMEAFLAGDDAAFGDENLCAGGLLGELIAEKYFAEIGIPDAVKFTDEERRRLDRLREHYDDVRIKWEHKECRERAIRNGVLRRYEILLEAGAYPRSAWMQAIAPGPASIVRDIPIDEVEGESHGRRQ